MKKQTTQKLENIKKAINSRVRGSNVPELDDVDTTPFFEGITFVVTGAFNESKYSRKQIEALINQHGGKVSSSLSEKTDYFIFSRKGSAALPKMSLTWLDERKDLNNPKICNIIKI